MIDKRDRKEIANRIFRLTFRLLNMEGLTCKDAMRLTATKYGYLGTDHMDDDQLVFTLSELENNLNEANEIVGGDAK